MTIKMIASIDFPHQEGQAVRRIKAGQPFDAEDEAQAKSYERRGRAKRKNPKSSQAKPKPAPKAKAGATERTE